ncbi:MAG TPA: Fur family transcriptional regulator [Patescibacteria group bacterium]|nr:Fur family transcriptional regulator [Patescibacteria group bacterium]
MSDYKHILQKANLKVTHAREAVLMYLTETDAPVDVLNIVAWLGQKNINVDKVTVYRILDAFYKKRIIDRIEFGEGKFRYELSGSDHHHLICEQCGNIEDISDCNIGILEKEIAKKKHFLVKRHALEFYGLCQNCQR